MTRTQRTDRPCSFCAEHAGVIASDVTATCICDRCLGTCCDILAEAIGGKATDVPASAWSVHQIESIVDVVRAKAAAGTLSRARESFCCDFCRAAEKDVAYLIKGPRVFVCETCVATAVPLLVATPAVD